MRRFATLMLLLMTTGCAGMYVAGDVGADQSHAATYPQQSH